MNENRREFLEKGLITAGVLGLGLVAGETVRKVVQPPPAPTPPRPTLPVLTPAGELIHVEVPPRTTGAPSMPAGLPADDPAVRQGVPGRKWVMVIDLAKCDGCKKCTRECNKMHHTPPEREWIRVFQMQEARDTSAYWFPKPCFHCDNPPCTKVCPVGATFKREDGVVLIDNTRCIGCRFCMAACPYSTRFFNWDRPESPPETQARPYSPETGFPRRIGTVEKCDFCPDMAAQGMLPACITSCAMGALYYGDEVENAVTNSKGETLRLSALLEEGAAYRYMEDLGTEPRVYYLPQKHRAYPGPGKQVKPEREHGGKPT